MTLSERIAGHARRFPQRIALIGADERLSYGALHTLIDVVSEWLLKAGYDVLAVDMANGPAWAVLDIAAMQAGICLVPLAPFFSESQLRHVLAISGAQAVVTDAADSLRKRCRGSLADDENVLAIGAAELSCIATMRDGVSGERPALQGVHKVTFTSGTTGNPKGVMLTWAQMRQVVESLAEATEVSTSDRHLALMPLAVLLENIGGVYVPLWAGATSILLPGHQVGLSGSSGLDGSAMTAALIEQRATTVIFTPQTLQGVVETVERNPAGEPGLRFAAVGGAPVSPRLLERAARCGMPVYEGYGLSEYCSVVCLNTRTRNKPGTVGRPLAHVRLRVDRDAEVVVEGVEFAGYLDSSDSRGRSATTPAARAWPTGDLGEIDADGYLQLKGRRRNVFITAFGRNVAPEWVERELALEPEIAQAAVFGEAQPFNVALLVPSGNIPAAQLQAAVARANQNLPDYARVSRWIAVSPFTPANGLLTGTGRIRRDRLAELYRDDIESFFVEAQSS